MTNTNCLVSFLGVLILFLPTFASAGETTHSTMPFPRYGRWCGLTGDALAKRLQSRKRWGWNPVDRLCRDFYRCCKETVQSSGDQKGLCHCRCYKTIRRKMYRAIRRTRSRKGRRIGHKIRRMLKFHRCRCDDGRFCKSGRNCRVENVCRYQKRVCSGGKCRWIRQKNCSRQVQCYLVNQCVKLTQNGYGGQCDKRSVVLQREDNAYRVRYLNNLLKKKR